MRFTVVVEKSAETQLIRIWMRALDQQEVADASNRIERELAVNAEKKGTPLGVFRTYTEDPLAVLYQVDPGDCMVRIIQYRRTK